MKEVSAAIIVEKDNVLLTRRAPNEKLAGYWEFPGGKREAGENIEECLVRELKEELDIKVEASGIFDVSEYHYDGGSILLIGVRARILNGTPALSVHDAFEWVPLTQVHQYKLAPADIPLATKLVEEYGKS